MIDIAKLPNCLEILGFSSDSTQKIYTKKYSCSSGYSTITVDFNKKSISYPSEIDTGSNTTTHFSQNENFVVLECVDRLLEKGYKPEHLALEKEWKLGHSGKSGRADIVVTDNNGKTILIIECKTAGVEFKNAWQDTLTDGAQLFSYLQQERATGFLCLYTSDLENNEIKSEYRLINIQDNEEFLKNNKHKKLKSYEKANTVPELFAVWRDTYAQEFATRGLFERDIAAYEIGKNKYTTKDLQEIDATSLQKKYHEFATILRQHNVSGRENAFDKLVNLFLAKVVDESNHQDELHFYWKGIAYDDYFSLQDRLQRLYRDGMQKFLNEEVTYIDNAEIENAFKLFKNDPDSTRETILAYFRKLKFFTTNDFAFIDVHNEELFYQNAEVLLKIVKMLQDIRLKTDKQNQFLGDLFEGFLNQGVKQSEGQFFTPMPIVRFIISALPLQEFLNTHNEPPKVIDYACGAGHFLTEYAEQIKSFVTQEKRKEHYQNIFGVEKEYRLSKVSKVSAFMYGQDEINIIYGDALMSHEDIKDNTFSLLVANPPYSVKGFLETLPEKQREKYILNSAVSDRQKNNAIEAFFIERAAQLLQAKGLAAIILPSSILSNGNIYTTTREILLQNFDIVSIAEFGSGTFGQTGTNTVTLFLRKKDDNPALKDHYRNRVNAWFNQDTNKDAVFLDSELLQKYCAHIDVQLADYETLFSGSLKNDIFQYDIFKEYQQKYSDDTQAKNIKKKKITAKYSQEDQQKDLENHLYQSILEIEKEKLYYFMLAQSQTCPVLVIKSPAEKKEMKAFLGYEWSNAKGSEGIKYIGVTNETKLAANDSDDQILQQLKGIEGIKTSLYNPQNFADEYKLNTLIRRNFSGSLKEIPKNLQTYANLYRLTDLLDFSRTEFDKQIKTTATKKVEIQSKYPLVKLGEVAEIYQPKTITGEQIKNSGKYKVFGANGVIGYYDEYNHENAEVAMTCRGATCGTINLTEPKSWITGNAMVISPKDENSLLKLYLKNYLEFSDLSFVITGSAQPQITRTNLSPIQLPLPPLAVQKEIVSECQKIDDEYNQSRMSIEEYKKKVSEKFAELDSKANKVVKLTDEEIFNVSIGRRVLNTEVSPDFSIPVYSANVFEPFGMIDKNLLDDFSKSSVLWGIDGDWMVNTIAKNIPFYPTDHCGVLRVDEKVISPRYAAYLLEKAGQSVGFKRSYRASIDRVKSLSFKIPPIAEQEKIVAEIEGYEKEIEKARAIMHACPERKKAVLEKYLN